MHTYECIRIQTNASEYICAYTSECGCELMQLVQHPAPCCPNCLTHPPHNSPQASHGASLTPRTSQEGSPLCYGRAIIPAQTHGAGGTARGSGMPLSPRGRAPRPVCQRSDEGGRGRASDRCWLTALTLAAPPAQGVAGLGPENRPPMAPSTLSSTTPATMPVAMSTLKQR